MVSEQYPETRLALAFTRKSGRADARHDPAMAPPRIPAHDPGALAPDQHSVDSDFDWSLQLPRGKRSNICSGGATNDRVPDHPRAVPSAGRVLHRRYGQDGDRHSHEDDDEFAWAAKNW